MTTASTHQLHLDITYFLDDDHHVDIQRIAEVFVLACKGADLTLSDTIARFTNTWDRIAVVKDPDGTFGFIPTDTLNKH